MTERLRKAWEVKIAGYDETEIFYGPTARAVFQNVWRRISGLREGSKEDIRVQRHPAADQRLPARDPAADLLTHEQTHCLMHAFGASCGDPLKYGYRDYYYTRRDNPPLVELTNFGLMRIAEAKDTPDNMVYFLLTDKGKRVALSLTPEY